MGLYSKKEWFYLALGHRRGPVTKAELQKLLADEDVFVDSTKVWKEGMNEWVELINSKDFSSFIKKLKLEAKKADVRVRQEAESDEVDEEVECRGATRALFNVFFYIGWIVPIILVVALITELQVFQILPLELVVSHRWILLIPLFFSVIALWQMAVSRMKHAGYSRSHGHTIFVPLWNIWTLLVCLLAPRNFRRKKKVDKGAVVSFLLLFFVVGVVALGLFPGFKAKDLSPLEINTNLYDFYAEKTDFRDRYNSKVQQSANVDARREQMQKQKEAANRAQRTQNNQRMSDKRGVK